MIKTIAATISILLLATQVSGGVRKVATSGDWTVLCDPISCVAAQSVKYRGLKRVDFQIFPIDGPERAAALSIKLSRDVDTTRGATIYIDGKHGLAYKFTKCTRSGCVLQLGLAKKTLDTYRKGQIGEIHYYYTGKPNKPEKFQFSLYGFAGAFGEVEKRNGPAKSEN